MGKIYQGILGPFSGKVGTVVGSIRKGQGYMRGLAASKKDARTESQLAQRAKFAITQKLLKGITPYLRVGYRGNTDTATPYNVATSKNVKLCIAGKYPSLGFDPSKLVLSEGSLEGVEIYAASIKNNVATFTWTDNSDEQSANMNDFAMPMVYNFSKCKAIYSLEKASRVDGNTTLDIPASWKNDKLSCYIAFAAVETKIQNPNKSIPPTPYIYNVYPPPPKKSKKHLPISKKSTNFALAKSQTAHLQPSQSRAKAHQKPNCKNFFKKSVKNLHSPNKGCNFASLSAREENHFP